MFVVKPIIKITLASLFLAACSIHAVTSHDKDNQKRAAGKNGEQDGKAGTVKTAGGASKKSASAAVVDIDVYSSKTERPDRYKVGTLRVLDLKTIRVLSSSGEKAGKLNRVVDEMNSREYLTLDGESMRIEGGDKVIAHSSMMVKKGDQYFAHAVRSELSDRGFGSEFVSPSQRDGGIDKLFELFDRVEKLEQFSEPDLAKVLGVKLRLSDESNRPFFIVYNAQFGAGPYKDLIASAEARIPDVEGTVCLVNLDFRSGVELSRKQIEAKYKTVEFTPASASAPKSVNDMLIVRRGRMEIVFGLSREGGASTVRSVSLHLKTP